MASRAVRKALKEQEARDLVNHADQEESDEEEQAARPQKSAFALLNALAGDDNDDKNDDDDNNDDDEVSESDHKDIQSPAAATIARPKSAKRKKKKRSKAPPPDTNVDVDPDMDEIDAALQALGTSRPDAVSQPQIDESLAPLKVDTSHLHAENEMRRLFGRSALHTETEDQPRRRNRPQQGLAAAVGQQGRSGLASLSLRRNIFIQGQEDWPRGTSEGLSMQVVSKRADGTTEYAYVHSKAYRDIQTRFNACVESMDPERMIALLQRHPYHVSTLLQVSEIAKQERDHTTSGVLLERALFSFGRCVHTSFAADLAAGKARLDFQRFENRELWTAATRYIANLSMRSTWRTVFEWAKMLLALDPTGDPYCLGLVIDQYALRARQHQQMLGLIGALDLSGPNIAFSKALALTQTGQEGKGKQALYTAVAKYPYMVTELCKEIKVDPPSGVWGKMPRSEWETLHTALYASRAKDVWNTPEATNLLLEVASALSTELPDPAVLDEPIDRDLCRHVLLTDQPALIALLPKNITSQVQSVSDPLPPDGNVTYEEPQTENVLSMWLAQFVDMYGTMLESISGTGQEPKTDYSLDELKDWIREEDQNRTEEDRRMTDDEVERFAHGLELIQQVIGQRAVGLFVARHRSGGSGPEFDRAEQEICDLFTQLIP